MKKKKYIVLSAAVLVISIVVTGFTNGTLLCDKTKSNFIKESKQKQFINMLVTHGHCNTAFVGVVDNLKLELEPRADLGNPLENMKISFEIDPNSFNVCANNELTERIKTPGLFIGDNDERITFRTVDVYTIGIDWYQFNGKLSIKGVEKNVTFFASGIRRTEEKVSTLLVLEGQFNLLDWGIDYDKIVNGKPDPIPTKMMHMNMIIIL